MERKSELLQRKPENSCTGYLWIRQFHCLARGFGRKTHAISEEGKVFVDGSGIDFAILSESDLGETTPSTPALSDGLILFRTVKGLVAVGKEHKR
ncbi:MAG: hypothetical protein R2751_16870 [Bacteroidales bacterium]